MNKVTTNLDRRILWGWIALLAAAVVVYAVGIAHESFWYDEAYSSVMASHLPWQIPALVTVDNHPPLYYMLLSLVRLALGNSEWALRSLSVAGAVGLVALGAGPVRRIFGDRNAFLYGDRGAVHAGRSHLCPRSADVLVGDLRGDGRRIVRVSGGDGEPRARLGAVRRGYAGRRLPPLLWTDRSLLPACAGLFLACDQAARAVEDVSDRRRGCGRGLSSLADRLHPADAERA